MSTPTTDRLDLPIVAFPKKTQCEMKIGQRGPAHAAGKLHLRQLLFDVALLRDDTLLDDAR